MEEKIFRAPAVAGILEPSYVEARLHADGQAFIERIRELQEELAGSRATPYYVIADPATGERLAAFEGFTGDPERFAEFLELGLQRASGKT